MNLGSVPFLLDELNANSAAIGCKRQDYNRNVLDQILDELDLVHPVLGLKHFDLTPTYFQYYLTSAIHDAADRAKNYKYDNWKILSFDLSHQYYASHHLGIAYIEENVLQLSWLQDYSHHV